MSEQIPESDRDEASAPQGGQRASTPFDKPYFMPVLLFILALWFGYDGWFNEEIESILFNRVVFGLLVAMTVYTTYQDVRDSRKSKD
jgi:hypothetical protein